MCGAKIFSLKLSCGCFAGSTPGKPQGPVYSGNGEGISRGLFDMQNQPTETRSYRYKNNQWQYPDKIFYILARPAPVTAVGDSQQAA